MYTEITNTECVYVAGVLCHHPYMPHLYILTTDETLLYEHLRAYCNKAIKLRLWNFYLIWAGLSLSIFVRAFLLNLAMATLHSAAFWNNFYLVNLSSFLFFLLFIFFNSITKYECIIFSRTFRFFPQCLCVCFFRCVWLVGLMALIRTLSYDDDYIYIHTQKYVRHSTFAFSVLKIPPFWLIADAKIQKITPSLKYLMEKEVYYIYGVDFYALYVKRERSKYKEWKGNEIQIRIKNPTSIFFIVFFFVVVVFLFAVALLLFAAFHCCGNIS